MKEINVTKYKCEVCGAVYTDREDAASCESRAVTQDKGVKVGDQVMITSGDGSGRMCRITSISVLSKEWGHYMYERYWHTIALHGDVVGEWGSRMLTFDSYAVVKD